MGIASFMVSLVLNLFGNTFARFINRAGGDAAGTCPTAQSKWMVVIAGVLVGIPGARPDIFLKHLSVFIEAIITGGNLLDYLQGLASIPVGDWRYLVVLAGSVPGAIWVFNA